MSGYRQSSYDPNAFERMGGVMRPFNWVQWIGVAMFGVGVALLLAMIAGGLGVASLERFRHFPAVFPIIVGQFLIYSRRHPSHDLAPELAPARRRMLIIIVAICTAAIGAAAVIQFSGA